MKKCPKCGVLFGQNGGLPARYEYCPYDGTLLDTVYRKTNLERINEDREEMNTWDYAVPWNEDIKVKGLEDESF